MLLPWTILINSIIILTTLLTLIPISMVYNFIVPRNEVITRISQPLMKKERKNLDPKLRCPAQLSINISGESVRPLAALLH